MDSAFIQERIDRIKTLIPIYEDALEALATAGPNKFYSLSTGQTTQTVTKRDMPQIQDTLDRLYASLDYWTSRFDGTAVTYVR